MFIRMKTGRYAGEVREVVFEAARDLVKSGQAEKISFDARESQTQMLLDSATSRGHAPAELPLPVHAREISRRKKARR